MPKQISKTFKENVFRGKTCANFSVKNYVFSYVTKVKGWYFKYP